jgi:hypothetical protein
MPAARSIATIAFVSNSLDIISVKLAMLRKQKGFERIEIVFPLPVVPKRLVHAGDEIADESPEECWRSIGDAEEFELHLNS